MAIKRKDPSRTLWRCLQKAGRSGEKQLRCHRAFERATGSSGVALRGLRGTSDDHARAFASEIHVARKPISFGCTAAQRAHGAASVHYKGAPSARRREALREADQILGSMCVCKRG